MSLFDECRYWFTEDAEHFGDDNDFFQYLTGKETNTMPCNEPMREEFTTLFQSLIEDFSEALDNIPDPTREALKCAYEAALLTFATSMVTIQDLLTVAKDLSKAGQE